MKNIFRIEKEIQEIEFCIPSISNELTYALFDKIKPIIRTGKDSYSYIENVDPISYSFTWEPKPYRKVRENLTLIDTVFVLHDCYYALYKGSMEEVFAFIQHHPQIDDIDLIEASFAAIHESGGGVISKVNLFKKEK